MTVRELRDLIKDLPEDDFIFVDGYEGGYDMPRLAETHLKTLEPWVESSGYCGPWSQVRFGADGEHVWVLERGE